MVKLLQLILNPVCLKLKFSKNIFDSESCGCKKQFGKVRNILSECFLIKMGQALMPD